MTGHRSFHVMAKPAGARCNLACSYCFYLSKGALYPGSSLRMSPEVMESYIRQTCTAHEGLPVSISWQGGEPTLMGLDFFRRAIEIEKGFLEGGAVIENTIQTNGTLIDEDWCRFFRENDVLVGLSMDGPRQMHDAFRRDGNARSVFDAVVRAAGLMREHQVRFNILCAVNAVNSLQPLELYRFFKDELQVRYIQFIPVVERARGSSSSHPQTVTGASVGGAAYGRFLVEIFDEWVRNDVGTMFIQPFEGVLSSYCHNESSLCIFRATCGDALVLEHNGDLYACDHFVDPAHLLGNILERHVNDLASSDRQRAFGAAKTGTLPLFCRACPFLFACHGECPRNRILRTPDGEPGLNWLCEGLRSFFAHTQGPMRLMAELIRAGRPAFEVMNVLALQEGRPMRHPPRTGRNDPCPCGSGRKFKHCHGRE
ncbi:MAG TPA: anaerobic sulfatase maturase [Deltaproteobacteria bacterium]|nr:anaerobic sulfatase maturase [Deltaproteobacteria bacterium]HQM72620.1 anaerobic sulfatase maturase [Deltaproteobacteria bacterium]